MQGTIYKRVRHQCKTEKPRWVRLPNPTPKVVSCSTCGSNLTTEKDVRYDASWWALGKKRSKSFPRKHDAQRHLTGVVQATHEGTYQPTRAVTMGAVFDAWREHLDGKRHKGLLKHSTLLSYRGILEKYLRPAFGAIRSDRLTSQVVISWESRLAETLAPKTLNNVVTTMRGLLSWAREQQFLAHDPMATIKPARVPRDEQPCLQPSELNNLLDAAATLPTRDQAIVYLAAYSGLRRGELFGLQWGDLDESKHQIHVRRSLFRGVTGEPKTASSRRAMDLPAPIVARLVAYREQYPPIGEDEFMFRNDAGRPLNMNSWTTKVLVPLYRRAGLNPKRPFHSLRHGYASMLINNNENVKYVSAQLGHASISMTMDRYGHLYRVTGERAMERLSQQVHVHTPSYTPGGPVISMNGVEQAGNQYAVSR